MGFLKNKKAQSTLEYVIVLSAIVGAVVAAVVLLGRKDNTAGLGQVMDTAATRITAATARLPMGSQ